MSTGARSLGNSYSPGRSAARGNYDCLQHTLILCDVCTEAEEIVKNHLTTKQQERILY